MPRFAQHPSASLINEEKTVKRRLLNTFLLVVLTLVALISLAACFGDAPCDHMDEDGDGLCDACGGEYGAETGELTLVESGVPTFQFVLSRDMSNAAKSQANSAINDINKLLSKRADTVNEMEPRERDIEIIIGTPTNRDEEYKVDYHYLGPEGYAVKLVGTKVLVLYGSDDAIGAALEQVKATLFGITAQTDWIKNVVVNEKKLVEFKQSFNLVSATVCGNDLRNYVLDYPISMRDAAQRLQSGLYMGVGIWLPKGTASATQKAVIFKEAAKGADPNGFVIYVDGDGNLVVETEFSNNAGKGIDIFLSQTVAFPGRKEMHYGADYVFDGYDAKNIYYSDFGAVGNGIHDDFEAIKACHEFANRYGYTVNADENAVYLIGKDKGSDYIEIKTDTNWHGCRFILDDSLLTPEDAAWNSYTFRITGDYSKKTYTASDLPVKTIEKGAANIGWAPGYRAMVVFKDETKKVYIRYSFLIGDDGEPLQEFVIVDENGNIDPSTPIQWDFTNITSIEVVRIEDKPIVISGGEYDEQAGIDKRAVFETRVFQTLTETPVGYRKGTIDISRSNVTFKNIYHEIVGEYDVEHGCSYYGFTNTSNADNVRYENITFQRYRVFNSSYRSYEVRVGMSNNVLWYNCNMSNFFGSNGEVYSYGMMGTSHSKNLTFDRVEFNTFDSHRGGYNATIRNSTLVFVSYIGAGKLNVENTTFYTTRKDSETHAIWLRKDYGSHFDGDMVVSGVTLKYADYNNRAPEVALISATWVNHYFGYKTVMGRSITVNDIKLEKIEYGIGNDGERWERTVSGTTKLYLFTSNMYSYTNYDISGDKIYGSTNKNPYKGPETITITNCPGITWVLPTANMPQFKNTFVTVDGKRQY